MKKLFTKLLAVMSAGIMAVTANLSVSAEAWDEAVNYDDPLWIVEYVTDKELIYSSEGGFYVTEDGEFGAYAWGGISVHYIVPENSEELTLEKLGLSDEDYKLVYDFRDMSVDGAKIYAIVVSTLEEADALFEKAKAIADTGVFLNAYKCCSYVHGCCYGGGFNIKLKDAEAVFDFSCIEECEGLEIQQSTTDSATYFIPFRNGFVYKSVMEAKETIEADENVESFESRCCVCAVAHKETKKEYLFEETIVPYYAFMTLAGDIDLDDETGISDIVTLTKYTASPELYPITDKEALGNADMNKDNVIDAVDTAILIENSLSGYESAV